MNFYKHHLGDYAKDTAHLSWMEDCAYRRCLDAYYGREAALPVDRAAVYRLVRASSASERKAVDTVLTEFFTKRDDGWHNKRADEEVTKYVAQANTNRRIAEEREVKRTKQRTVHEPSTNRPPVYSGEREPSQNQNQIPERNTHSQLPVVGTKAGAISAKLRALGVTITPSNPVLLAWIEAGATEQIVAEAVTMARVNKPAPDPIPARYLDPIVRELMAPKPAGNGSHHEPVDETCGYIQDGVKCGKPYSFANLHRTRFHCREHGPV